jgi:GNAT superfamily N-acetyltransferase
MEARTATPDDAEAISALASEVQRLHAEALPDLFKPPSPEFFPATHVRQLLADPANVMFIAHCEGEPAGYIYAEIARHAEDRYCYARDRLYIHHISVNSVHQRQGVGQALIHAVIEVAKERGLSTIAADFWSFNAKARGFFAAQGFKAYNENVWLHLGERK